jgi:hypothetical protein
VRAKNTVFLAVGVAVAVVAGLFAGSVRMFHLGAPTSAVMASMYPPGTRAEFDRLSQQNSNSCGLQPSTVEGYADTARIQGSCCSAMEWSHYQNQTQGLRNYRALAQVPRDPYDIPGGLAKQLLAYERSIHLTSAQRLVYQRAVQIAPEKGPCCCPCWRWHAFKGLAQYLITREHYSARHVASVIGLVDGCGGKG